MDVDTFLEVTKDLPNVCTDSRVLSNDLTLIQVTVVVVEGGGERQGEHAQQDVELFFSEFR